MRFFDTTGPVVPEDHYRVPPLARWDLDGIPALVRDKRHFAPRAPRQGGKASAPSALRDLPNPGEAGEYLRVCAEVVPRGLTCHAQEGLVGDTARHVMKTEN